MRDSGVYAIRLIGTEKCYIGSSQDIAWRWYHHRRNLRLGQHPSPHLQNAWNKYGQEAFGFTVLESCSVDKLLEREQYFIETLQPSFNSARYAGAPMRGRVHSDEWKAKARAMMLGNKYAAGHTHTDEWKAATSLLQRGSKHSGGWTHTSESKAKIASAMRGKRHAAGHIPTADETAKRTAAIKAQWALRQQRTLNPETRAKISLGLIGNKNRLGVSLSGA